MGGQLSKLPYYALHDPHPVISTTCAAYQDRLLAIRNCPYRPVEDLMWRRQSLGAAAATSCTKGRRGGD